MLHIQLNLTSLHIKQDSELGECWFAKDAEALISNQLVMLQLINQMK